jgi:DNA replicative helicase MCM subunit Mcm2 (Cdc46/Mcm family)
MKQKILLSLAFVTIIASALIINIHLFTKDRVFELGHSIGYSSHNGSLDLGNLLIYNYSRIPNDFFNEQTGENKWRSMLATDPTLAYTAVDLYSSEFLEGFKVGFEERKKNQITSMINDKKNYSEYEIEMVLSKNHEDFLRLTLGNMRKYQNLIDDLLKLDDSKLNLLINSISKDPVALDYSENIEPVEAKELKKWLVLNGYITNVDEMNYKIMPTFYNFPTDVILLTRRISSSYPSWTNRRTLQEMKKFSLHVQNKLNVK